MQGKSMSFVEMASTGDRWSQFVKSAINRLTPRSEERKYRVKSNGVKKFGNVVMLRQMAFQNGERGCGPGQGECPMSAQVNQLSFSCSDRGLEPRNWLMGAKCHRCRDVKRAQEEQVGEGRNAFVRRGREERRRWKIVRKTRALTHR